MKCNICGNGGFVPGPNGRMSRGAPPMCGNCKSLERHRIIRLCYDAIRSHSEEVIATARCVQFAKDVSVDPAWFREWDYSEYGGHNSMNVMELPLADESVGWFVLNHILEHVADDKKAFGELIRCLTPEGVVQITVPSPTQHFATDDWGYPDPNKILHYREYGSDLFVRVADWGKELGFITISALPRDPVTNVSDAVLFSTKSPETAKRAFDAFKRRDIIALRLS